MAAPKITTGYTQPGTKLIVKPDIAKYTDKNGKVSAKYQTDLTNFYAKSTDPEAVKYRTDELTKKYGSLKDADGKTIFTPTYIKALAEGIEPPASLDKAVTDWATAKMKEATNYDWNNFSGGIGSVAAQNLLRSFVKDPSQVDTALTFKSSGADVTPEQKQANAANLEAKVAKAEKDTATLENYDPNAGAWNPSKNTQATPYGDVLSGLISGYKNPYASDYVNPLTAVEKPNLTNIQTPFNKNAIPQDLVSLFNSAGTNYAGGTRANPLVRPTLPNNGLVKLTQPSATESAEQLAKPGAPDTTNTTLPVVPKAGEPIVTDTSAGQVVNPPVVNPPVVNPPVVNPPVVNPPVKTAAELAAEKAEADRLAEVNRLAAEKAEAERQAGIKTLAEKAEADRLAAEKAAVVTTPGKLTFQPVDGVVVSAEERAKNLEAARIAQEAVAKRQAEEKAEAERQAGLVALANQQAAEKAEATRLAAEKANTIFQQGNITAMPTGTAATGSNVFEKLPSNVIPNQYVSLPDNTVVQSVNPTTSNQTVSLTPTGPQPVYAATSSPTPAQNAGIVGAIDPSTLSVSSMNSNAGGVASLVGPVAPAVQASAVPSTVSSLPKYNAPAQTVINAGATQVLDSSGTPIPGRRRLGFA
jgi:hypothetical protein